MSIPIYDFIDSSMKTLNFELPSQSETYDYQQLCNKHYTGHIPVPSVIKYLPPSLMKSRGNTAFELGQLFMPIVYARLKEIQDNNNKLTSSICRSIRELLGENEIITNYDFEYNIQVYEGYIAFYRPDGGLAGNFGGDDKNSYGVAYTSKDGPAHVHNESPAVLRAIGPSNDKRVQWYNASVPIESPGGSHDHLRAMVDGDICFVPQGIVHGHIIPSGVESYLSGMDAKEIDQWAGVKEIVFGFAQGCDHTLDIDTGCLGDFQIISQYNDQYKKKAYETIANTIKGITIT